MKLVLHYILIISGILFILIGLAGLVLPIIPGILFIVLGIIVMGKKDLVLRWIGKLPPPLNRVIYFLKK